MININGKSYQGNNLTIVNGKVFIDGVEQTPEDKAKEISITVDGNIDTLKVDSAIWVKINGHVNNASTISGDLHIAGDVRGAASSVSGDIECDDIGGSVSTISGDIKQRRK